MKVHFFKINPAYVFNYLGMECQNFKIQNVVSPICLKNLEKYITLDNHLTAHVQVTPKMAVKLLENVDYIITNER